MNDPSLTEQAAASVTDVLAEIIVNEQSSIRIGAAKTLYFDPFRLPDAPGDADVVFITHSHYDHFSPDDIEKVRKDGTVFVIPASMQADVEGLGVPSDHIVTLAPGDTAEVCGFNVEAVAAYNVNKKYHPKANGWLGYVVTVDGVRVYVAGDTDATEEAKAVRCDIAMLPIGGTYTMTAEEARNLALLLAPAAAVPTHYGTVVGDPADYDVFAEGLACAVKKLTF